MSGQAFAQSGIGRLAVLGALAATACAHPQRAAPAKSAAAKSAAAARGAERGGDDAAQGARVFQGLPEEAFWVEHTSDRDRVVAGGSRLELTPRGEVTAAAWEVELATTGELIVGSLAVPAHLGGGFVHWSRSRVFRSKEFTGPLEPVVAGAAGDAGVRGARSGLSSVVVITEAGPRELLPGSSKLTPMRAPGVFDLVALDASRALRLDLFGRAAATDDGGKTWADLSPRAGVAVRSLGQTPSELLLETWQGRFSVGGGGKVSLIDPQGGRQSHLQWQSFQTVFKGTRAGEREEWPWGWRDATPLQAALMSGARLDDGTALGVIQQVVSRVDLATGRLVGLATDWLPNGLECGLVRADDGVLFACTWQRYQGYGGYVMRSVAGEPPELERAFTDDGGFVADDDGAIGFAGSCLATERLFDPNDPSNNDWAPREPKPRSVFCVRRGPGDWIERRAEAGEGASLVAWAPRKDGSAVALAMSNEALPQPARGGGPAGLERAPRVSEQGGVRVVRLARALRGWSFDRPQWQFYGRSGVSKLDRRFRAHDDGSVDAWLTLQGQSYVQIAVGATVEADGRLTIHDTAPGLMAMIHGGSTGVALGRDGELFETVDHGRSWRFAGPAAAPLPTYNNGGTSGCSALGCSLGAVVRVGWGEGKLAPRVKAEPMPAPEATASLPRLACAARGTPSPIAVAPAPPGAAQHLATSWGETIEIVRDASVPEPPPPPWRGGYAPNPPPPAPSATASGSAGKKPPRASPAVLKTHTLTFRVPFDPSGPRRRLNATDASFSTQRRASITPLLAAGGDVSLLIAGETTELHVSRDKIVSLPIVDARRYGHSDGSSGAGLALDGDRALMIGDIRRRIAIEQHGPGAPLPPLYFGVDRDPHRRRPLTLGRRDDGATGVLVFDGSAPETAGVAVIGGAGAFASPAVALAPWSSVVTADDPRCKAGEKGAWRAIVMIDPSQWLEIAPRSLGVQPARQGMALVRWGRERVCLEALDVAVSDARRRSEAPRTWSLVARWGSAGGATLRAADLQQDLACTIEAPGRRAEGS